MDAMQLEMISPHDWKNGETASMPVHSFVTTDLAVFFVYGDDMERQQYSFFASYLGKRTNQLAWLIWFVFSAVLCYLRRRLRLRRDGFISCLIDCVAATLGGGTIRITHRYERWLFAIYFVGNFFVMAIWSGILFLPTFFELDRNIESIQQISTINPPIFIDPTLEKSEKDIVYLLRFGSFSNISNCLNILSYFFTSRSSILKFQRRYWTEPSLCRRQTVCRANQSARVIIRICS